MLCRLERDLQELGTSSGATPPLESAQVMLRTVKQCKTDVSVVHHYMCCNREGAL